MLQISVYDFCIAFKGKTKKKRLFKIRNNTVLGKTMENVRKHRDIKFVTTKTRRTYFVSKPNYFSNDLLSIAIKEHGYS